VASRIEVRAHEETREELIVQMRALAESLPPQRADSLTLLREDRAGNRY
jgi:hypothetical protein